MLKDEETYSNGDKEGIEITGEIKENQQDGRMNFPNLSVLDAHAYDGDFLRMFLGFMNNFGSIPNPTFHVPNTSSE